VVFPDNATALTGNVERLVGGLAPYGADNNDGIGNGEGRVEGAIN
jgi:hypothetical protein